MVGVGNLSKKTALTLASKIRSYLLSNLFVRNFTVLIGGLSKKTALTLDKILSQEYYY